MTHALPFAARLAARCLLIVAVWPGQVLAADTDAPPDPEPVLDRARALIRAGEHLEAATVLEAAQLEHPNERFLGNLGWIYETLERPGEALEYYERYIRVTTDEKNAATVGRRLARLRQSAAGHYERVTLSSRPPGAVVTIRFDGATRRAARTPAPIWLPHGDVEIGLDLPGHQPLLRPVTVSGDTARSLAFDLTPLRAMVALGPLPEDAVVTLDGTETEPVAPEGTLELAPGVYTLRVERPGHLPYERRVEVAAGEHAEVQVELVPAPVEVSKDAPAPEPEAEGTFEVPLATWISGSVAVAALAVGVGLGAAALSGAGEAAAYGDDPANSPSTWSRMRRDAEARALGADIAFGVAGGAAIASVVFLFVLQPDAASDASGTTIMPAAIPGGAGAVLRGGF